MEVSVFTIKSFHLIFRIAPLPSALSGVPPFTISLFYPIQKIRLKSSTRVGKGGTGDGIREGGGSVGGGECLTAS